MDKFLKKYQDYFASPYLVWVFMWVNAIKDIALFVDGPDCNFFRVDIIYKTHDLFSTLKEPSINTRLYFSWVMPNKMVLWYEDKIKRKISFIEKNDKFKLWIITNMPVTSLLGIQYDWIIKDFKKQYLIVPSYTDKFWIDWYSLFLREIAKKIDLNNNSQKKKKSISIIWYLFDRNEWDNFWNIEELKRIMNLIWVEINSIWLNGWKFDSLKKVEKSEILVILPYWKYAWKVLKKRLWVDTLELELPFWLKNTIDFVRKIWEKLKVDKNLISKVIKNEFNLIKNKINLLDDKVFLNKNFIYAWDPYLKSWIEDFSNFLWMNLVHSFSYNGDKIFYDEIKNNEIDFIIWNSEFNLENKKKIEFGFPSYNTHYLTNRAFMWFEGILNFIEMLYFEFWRNKELS
jgi:nitrogenase molybdenum-iron protein alpha/beta subunit